MDTFLPFCFIVVKYCLFCSSASPSMRKAERWGSQLAQVTRSQSVTLSRILTFKSIEPKIVKIAKRNIFRQNLTDVVPWRGGSGSNPSLSFMTFATQMRGDRAGGSEQLTAMTQFSPRLKESGAQISRIGMQANTSPNMLGWKNAAPATIPT